MIRRIGFAASVALIAGCGGPSPQEAEDYVRATLEDEGAIVTNVFCDEVSGDRYECEISWRPGEGAEEQSERTIVEADEIE